MTLNDEIVAAVAAVALVDHHVHSALTSPLSRAEFEQYLTESSQPPALGTTQFDSQVGFAVRNYCSPALGLERHASADDYWAARERLTPKQVTSSLVKASGISNSLIDTGVVAGDNSRARLFTLAEFADLSGQRTEEIVRLESLLEGLAAKGVDADDLEAAFDDVLRSAVATAVGLKSIIAYRFGFDFDPAEPESREIRSAAAGWLSAPGPYRVTDPVLLRMLLWKGVRTGLPVQLHAGYGDADLDLSRCNPLLLTPWLRILPAEASNVVLLHCYPFHREAGYLAQVFSRVYFDVGLAINYTGAMSDRIVAESLELAPFGKVLFSTDAWGLPELHLIGAALWRRAMTRILSDLVENNDWSLLDAIRVAQLVGRDNANRLYDLSLT